MALHSYFFMCIAFPELFYVRLVMYLSAVLFTPTPLSDLLNDFQQTPGSLYPAGFLTCRFRAQGGSTMREGKDCRSFKTQHVLELRCIVICWVHCQWENWCFILHDSQCKMLQQEKSLCSLGLTPNPDIYSSCFMLSIFLPLLNPLFILPITMLLA